MRDCGFIFRYLIVLGVRHARDTCVNLLLPHLIDRHDGGEVSAKGKRGDVYGESETSMMAPEVRRCQDQIVQFFDDIKLVENVVVE